MAGAPTPPGTTTPPPADGGARAEPPRSDTRRRLTRLAPVGLGAVLTLAAVLLIGFLSPKAPAVTQQNVDDAIASALSSQTPPPAFSQVVYQRVQPSLVLIQTEGDTDAAATEDVEDGLGSGVVVSVAGDILTSLHVVDGATAIELTFADGSTSPAEIVGEQPENDIAVLRALQPPQAIVPATLGHPGAVTQGSEAYALGSP